MGLKVADRSRWATFPTDVILGAREGDAIALGTPVGDHYGVPLVAAGEVLSFRVRKFAGAWTSANGTGYAITDDPQELLVRSGESWQRLAIDGGPARDARPVRVAGRSGAEPGADELFIAMEVGTRASGEGALLWRRHGLWRRVALPAGRVWALTAPASPERAMTERAAPERGVIVSIGALPDLREPPKLYRFLDGALAPLPLPADLGDESWGATALATLPDGALFACFAQQGSEALRAWTFDRATWRSVVFDEPARGWLLDYVGCAVWRGVLHLATSNGLFELQRAPAGDRLIRTGTLSGISLWPLEDALVCRGWRNGTHAHEIHRGDGWRPYLIPAPDTVRGGRGKVVWMPPKRQVPVRNVRMPAPVAPAPALPSADDTNFAPVLGALTGANRRTSEGAQRSSLAGERGCEPAADLTALLSVYAEFDIDGQLGAFRPWTSAPAALPPSDRAVDVLYGWQPGIIGLLTDTVPIGCDAGGQVYHARVSPNGSEVFLYGPGLGSLALLADSLSSFMNLNQILERWRGYERERDLDLEDVQRGDVDLDDAPVVAIREAIARLAGRVRFGDDGSEVMSDFDEIVTALVGSMPPVTTSAPTLRAFESSHWLAMALTGTYVDASPAREREREYASERADPAWWSLAGVRVYWLWHFYLLGDDDALIELAAELAHDPAAAARDTAEMLRALVGPRRDRPGTLGRFAGLRAAISEAETPRARGLDPAAAAPHLTRAHADDDDLAKLKTALAADAANVQRWDLLLYAYFGQKRYADMADAARVRLALADDHYYPWLQLGIARQATDQFDDAIHAYNRALVYRDYDGATWFNLAATYASLGEAETAVALLGRALDLQPDYRPVAAEASEFAALASHPAFRALVS